MAAVCETENMGEVSRGTVGTTTFVAGSNSALISEPSLAVMMIVGMLRSFNS